MSFNSEQSKNVKGGSFFDDIFTKKMVPGFEFIAYFSDLFFYWIYSIF